MVKGFVVGALCFINVYASVYEDNCMKCHESLPVELDKFYMKYVLKYSSRDQVQGALKDYLLAPNVETSLMSDAFIKRFGVKVKSTLSEEELDAAIFEFWERYRIDKKLK